MHYSNKRKYNFHPIIILDTFHPRLRFILHMSYETQYIIILQKVKQAQQV